MAEGIIAYKNRTILYSRHNEKQIWNRSRIRGYSNSLRTVRQYHPGYANREKGDCFLITASYVHMCICTYAPTEDIFGEIKKSIQFIIDAHEEILK